MGRRTACAGAPSGRMDYRQRRVGWHRRAGTRLAERQPPGARLPESSEARSQPWLRNQAGAERTRALRAAMPWWLAGIWSRATRRRPHGAGHVQAGLRTQQQRSQADQIRKASRLGAGAVLRTARCHQLRSHCRACWSDAAGFRVELVGMALAAGATCRRVDPRRRREEIGGSVQPWLADHWFGWHRRRLPATERRQRRAVWPADADR